MVRNRRRWHKEPLRHGLAAKRIKTVRKPRVSTGEARRLHSLDTSRGSLYHKLREQGMSDEEAQKAAFATRGIEVGRKSQRSYAKGDVDPRSIRDFHTPEEAKAFAKELLDESKKPWLVRDFGAEAGQGSYLVTTDIDMAEELIGDDFFILADPERLRVELASKRKFRVWFTVGFMEQMIDVEAISREQAVRLATEQLEEKGLKDAEFRAVWGTE